MTNDPTWLLHECVSSSVWRELKISSKMGEVLSMSNTTDPSCFVLLQLEEEGPQACTGGFGRSVALDGGKEGGWKEVREGSAAELARCRYGRCRFFQKK